MELNELGWWSRWARLRWHGEGYLLSSDSLKEPFFNRAGALTCGAVRETATWAERAFRSRGVGAAALVFDSCAVVKDLLASGYRQTDSMVVLRSTAPPEGGTPEPGVVQTTDSESWTSAYLRSFYGDEGLTDVVGPIVSSLQTSRAVTLLESRTDRETAGVLAMFRTPETLGVYCVGTAPDFRKTGVATALLMQAKRVASGEGRDLVLQTLTSDGALGFYLRRGFEAVYSKRLLTRDRQ